MKTITLGELLTEEQMDDVQAIINSHRIGDMDCTARLKQYFRGIGEQLESKGVLPEYLAYALPYSLGQGALGIPVPGHR